MADNSGPHPAKIRANMLIRDKYGRPKISWQNVYDFYHRLEPEDQKHVREKYPDHPLFQEAESGNDEEGKHD